MTALVVLGLLGVTALFLAGALTYLYRWRVRKKLFPQLPRLWKGDRSRFLVSTGLFVVSLLAFMVVSLATGPSMPEPPQKQMAKKAQGPSFDGAPPPPSPPPKKPDAPPTPASAAAPYSTPAAALNNEFQTAAQPKGIAPTPAPRQQPAAAQVPAAPAAQQAPNTQDLQQPATTKPSQVNTDAAPAAQPKAEPKASAPATAKPVKAPASEPAAQAAPAPAKESPPDQKKTSPAKTETPKSKAAAPVKAKKQAKAAPDSKPKAQKAAKTTSKAYTVCVASFKDPESAQQQVARLAKKGLKGRIVKAELKGKGVWYRVCLGEFSAPNQAAAKSKAWRDNDLVKTPFVVRLR